MFDQLYRKDHWAENFIQIMYHNLEPSDSRFWCSKPKLQTYASFADGARSPAYKKVPRAYLASEDDQRFPWMGKKK